MLNISDKTNEKKIKLQLSKEKNFYLMDEYTLSMGVAKDILMTYSYQIVSFLEEKKNELEQMHGIYAYLSLVHDRNSLEYPLLYRKAAETIESQMLAKIKSCKRVVKQQLSKNTVALEYLKLLLNSYDEEEYYLFSQFHRNMLGKDFYYQNYRYHQNRFLEHIKVWLNDISKEKIIGYHRLRYLEQAICQNNLTFPNIYPILKKMQKEIPMSSLSPESHLEFDIEKTKENSYLSYLIGCYHNRLNDILEEYNQVGDCVDDHIGNMLVKR